VSGNRIQAKASIFKFCAELVVFCAKPEWENYFNIFLSAKLKFSSIFLPDNDILLVAGKSA
jgi:hypothetical protein